MATIVTYNYCNNQKVYINGLRLKPSQSLSVVATDSKTAFISTTVNFYCNLIVKYDFMKT